MIWSVRQCRQEDPWGVHLRCLGSHQPIVKAYLDSLSCSLAALPSHSRYPTWLAWSTVAAAQSTHPSPPVPSFRSSHTRTHTSHKTHASLSQSQQQNTYYHNPHGLPLLELPPRRCIAACCMQETCKTRQPETWLAPQRHSEPASLPPSVINCGPGATTEDQHQHQPPPLPPPAAALLAGSHPRAGLRTRGRTAGAGFSLLLYACAVRERRWEVVRCDLVRQPGCPQIVCVCVVSQANIKNVGSLSSLHPVLRATGHTVYRTRSKPFLCARVCVCARVYV